MTDNTRKEITVINHYDVFPFDAGGKIYTRDLYKALSEWFDINIICFTESPYYDEVVPISKHLKVFPILLSDTMTERIHAMFEQYGMNDQTMIDYSPAVMRWYCLDDSIMECVRRIAENSFIIIAEHCYTWPIVKTAYPDKHLWYRSQNVEFDYASSTYPLIGSPKDVLDLVYEVEKDCLKNAEKVLTISSADADRFAELYYLDDVNKSRIMTIRCGYDLSAMHPILPEERQPADKSYKYCGFFISSIMQGREAVRDCIEIARMCPEIKIVLAGYSSIVAMHLDCPENIEALGYISEEQKKYYMTHCDFALNIINGGAGVNVKMFEYIAYGLPVIATPHGARGIELVSGVNCIITKRETYVKDIRDFCALDIKKRNSIAINALNMLREKYDWRILAKGVAEEIDRMYGIEVEQGALAEEEIALFNRQSTKQICMPENYYIRCAGYYGVSVLQYLRELEWKDPIAFVDNDRHKVGKKVEHINVISEDEFLKIKGSAKIIVAIEKGLISISANLVKRGISVNRLILAFDPRSLLDLSDESGECPLYCSPHRFRDEILKKAAM